MAPTRDPPVFSSLSAKDRHNKLRKPLVEKKRRDRINSCIEQLKVLLEKEFQDPEAKVEKADVLETTVVFLKRQLRPMTPNTGIAQAKGYSCCWRETLQFLSSRSQQGCDVMLPQLYVLRDVTSVAPLSPQPIQPAAKALPNQARAVWRPW